MRLEVKRGFPSASLKEEATEDSVLLWARISGIPSLPCFYSIYSGTSYLLTMVKIAYVSI